MLDPPRRTKPFVSSKRVNTTTGAIPTADSLTNLTFAMNAIKISITKIWLIIPARVNGAPPVDVGCPNFIEAKRPLAHGQFPTPTSPCRLYHRKFFGDQCYNYHLQRRSLRIKSICDSYKKCPDCSHVYEPDSKVRRGGNRRVPKHRCGSRKCHICQNRSS